MTPDELDAYLIVMSKHGVQNMHIEFDGKKLVVSGIYKDAQPIKMPDDDRSAIDELDRD